MALAGGPPHPTPPLQWFPLLRCVSHAHIIPVCPVPLQVRLFTGIMFSDQPVQDEERIFGGRYKDITVECDPPQKVVLDGEVSRGRLPGCDCGPCSRAARW